MTEMRQFVVLEIATGDRTYVRSEYDGNSNSWRHAATVAGFKHKDWWEKRVRVGLLHPADERALPFDVLPLVIRRRYSAAVA